MQLFGVYATEWAQYRVDVKPAGRPELCKTYGTKPADTSSQLSGAFVNYAFVSIAEKTFQVVTNEWNADQLIKDMIVRVPLLLMIFKSVFAVAITDI
jgi:hypothetical protein